MPEVGDEISFDLPDVFRNEGVVGQGGFGAVCKARLRNHQAAVAIKKIPSYTRSGDCARKVLREVEIITHFRFCSQIVPCYAIFRPAAQAHDIYMVMEYVAGDLSQLLSKPSIPLPDDAVMYIACQLLLALRALHRNGVMHRDLSTRNVLLDADTCRICVCDFGLSRFYDPDELMSFGVVTQWYRAPEILCGAQYDFKVDVWSVGVILGELLLRKYLFPGLINDSADQLSRIFALVGTPAPHVFEEGGSMSQASDMMKKFCRSRQRVECQMQNTDASRDLLLKLLKLDPAERPTADEALKHPWFESLRDFIQDQKDAQDGVNVPHSADDGDFWTNCERIEKIAPVVTDSMLSTMISEILSVSDEN
jgi:serine/threonine protein kinase